MTDEELIRLRVEAVDRMLASLRCPPYEPSEGDNAGALTYEDMEAFWRRIRWDIA